MAGKTKLKPSKGGVKDALAQLERPHVKWKIIAQIAAAFAILWVTAALMTSSPVGYWGVGVVGVLTAVAVGFGLYVWRLIHRSQRIVDILKGATDDAGRKSAIEKLGAQGPKDAMAALARAQLVATDDPAQAVTVLEAIDLNKAPAVVQDDVRANLALLYLATGRVREARVLADDVRLDRQPQPKSKAMYAAVVAESFARTGKPTDARKLLETYKADDPEYAEVCVLLLRAQVFTFHALKKRGLARSAMEHLAVSDPNALGFFVQKTAPLDLQKMAREVLQASGAIPRQKIRMH